MFLFIIINYKYNKAKYYKLTKKLQSLIRIKNN